MNVATNLFAISATTALGISSPNNAGTTTFFRIKYSMWKAALPTTKRPIIARLTICCGASCVTTYFHAPDQGKICIRSKDQCITPLSYTMHACSKIWEFALRTCMYS